MAKAGRVWWKLVIAEMVCRVVADGFLQVWAMGLRCMVDVEADAGWEVIVTS